jgi:hypothetical protein
MMINVGINQSSEFEYRMRHSDDKIVIVLKPVHQKLSEKPNSENESENEPVAGKTAGK